MTEQMHQIEVIENQLSAIAAGQITLDQVGQSLGELYDKAEAAQDERSLVLINTAWQHAQALAAVTEQAAGLATSAVAVATEAVHQRDVIAGEFGKVASEHSKLVKAVLEVDTDHPLVEELYQAAYESAEESAYEYMSEVYSEMDGIHTDQPGIDICENGHLGEEIDADTAEDFLYTVMGYSNNLSPELLEELAGFIKDFTPRCRQYWNAEHAKRVAEAEAARAKWLAERDQSQAKASGQ